MRIVLDEIMTAKEHFARLPLFQRMQSECLTPRERLAFFPCLAPFVLAYSDLRNHAFRDDSRSDPIQKIVNAHCQTGDGEWTWYLDDLARLGFDRRERPATEVLRHYGAEGAQVSRMLGLRLARLLFDARPIEKLLMLEAINAACNVLFALGAALAARIERESSLQLCYFSHCLRPELRRSTVRVLSASGLSEHDRAWCLVLVGHVFMLFTDWCDELLTYSCTAHAVNQPREQNDAPRGNEWPVLGVTRV